MIEIKRFGGAPRGYTFAPLVGKDKIFFHSFYFCPYNADAMVLSFEEENKQGGDDDRCQGRAR
jgi:hypothetical protein